MAVRWAVSSSNWSDVNTWNDGATLGIPVAADSVYANNRNITIDQSFSVVSLNNFARARDIATPVMTSDNTPSPFVAAASSVNTVGQEAFRVFDRNYAPGSNYWTAAANNGWVSMDFGSGSSVVIDGYTIYGSGGQTFNPRNWTLESSNDNVNWTVRHTVTLPSAIAANSLYSVASIGNTTGSRYYRVNITLNGGSSNIRITELELYQPGTAALAAGGSFIFNSGSISGSATSTTSALIAGATNLIQVTATTGSVGLTLGSSVTGLATAGQILSHTGNCNFNLSGLNFTGGSFNPSYCINKSSTGTITITGNLIGGGGAVGNTTSLFSTAGNTVVTGNIVASSLSIGLQQTAGNATIIGNITGGSSTGVVGLTLTGAASQFTIIGNITGGSGASAHGISTVGAVTVTGTVTGGAGSDARGISTSGVTTVTGNVIGGGGGVGIISSTNVTIIGNATGGSTQALGNTGTSNLTFNITGTATAGSAVAISTTSVSGTNQVVNLTGNMINVSGRQAIFAQNLFISNAATTQWRLFTQGGQDKTLYSADTFPNQPTSANVRSGSLFGPANALSGSMVVPAPSDVRVNVLTDNTVGTGQSLTAADFLAAISSSADPFAERLRNVATVDTVGSLVTGLNGGF